MRYNVTISGIVDADGFNGHDVAEAIEQYVARVAPVQYRGLRVTAVTEVREVTLTVPAEQADLIRRVLDLGLTVAEEAMLAETLDQHRYNVENNIDVDA
jgi:hypothetical protein